MLIRAKRLDGAEREVQGALAETRDVPLLRALALTSKAAWLLARGEAEDALAAAREAEPIVQSLGGRLQQEGPLFRRTLAQALRATGQDATEAFARARLVIEDCASRIEDPALRASYLLMFGGVESPP